MCLQLQHYLVAIVMVVKYLLELRGLVLVARLTSGQAVEEADGEVGELHPQVPEGEVLPLAAELFIKVKT